MTTEAIASPKISMKELFEAGVHFGHLTRFREPMMSEYIYGSRNKISIINLEKTLPMLKRAMSFIKEVAMRGGKVLFVGTKRAAKDLVVEYATQCGMPYVNCRWPGGLLTNYKTIRLSIKRLDAIYKMMEDGTINLMTKKERLTIERELQKLENSFGGIKKMGGLPDAIFVIDVGYESIAVQEANRLRIPVAGIVDTNSKADGVDHVIPGNDDSKRAIELYLSIAANLINEARESLKSVANTKLKDDFVEVADTKSSTSSVAK